MKRKAAAKYLLPLLCSLLVSLACTAESGAKSGNANAAQGILKVEEITAQTAIESVISDADFAPWGRLIFRYEKA